MNEKWHKKNIKSQEENIAYNDEKLYNLRKHLIRRQEELLEIEMDIRATEKWIVDYRERRINYDKSKLESIEWLEENHE